MRGNPRLKPKLPDVRSSDLLLTAILICDPLIEMLPRRRKLRSGSRFCHETRASDRGVRHRSKIPTEMFACESHPGVFAVEGVQAFEVRQDNTTHLRTREVCDRLLSGQPRIDRAKNPWRSMRGAAEHYSAGASDIKNRVS